MIPFTPKPRLKLHLLMAITCISLSGFALSIEDESTLPTPIADDSSAQDTAVPVRDNNDSVQIHSDRQDFFRDGRVIYKGNVSLSYGIHHLKADEIVIKTTRGKEWFVASGDPTTFTTNAPQNEENSIYAEAKSIEFSVQSDTLVLSQAILTSGRHRIEGETIEYNLITGQFSASKAKTTRFGVQKATPENQNIR